MNKLVEHLCGGPTKLVDTTQAILRGKPLGEIHVSKLIFHKPAEILETGKIADCRRQVRNGTWRKNWPVFGVIPIRGIFRVVDGHHRLKALEEEKKLVWVPCVDVTEFVHLFI